MIIDATRSDSESWRIQRVQKASRIFCKVFGITEKQIEYIVRSMHDHKGELFVEWYEEPTDQQKNAMNVAWGMVGEYNVHHKRSEVSLIKSETF